MELRLNSFMNQEIMTKENGCYIDEVRECYADLTLMGVSNNKIEEVVRAALKKIAGFDIEKIDLPKHTFARVPVI